MAFLLFNTKMLFNCHLNNSFFYKKENPSKYEFDNVSKFEIL